MCGAACVYIMLPQQRMDKRDTRMIKTEKDEEYNIEQKAELPN
jgi:uncharacterized membrane protein